MKKVNARKIIAVLLAAVLMTDLLAGCPREEKSPVEGKRVAYVM